MILEFFGQNYANLISLAIGVVGGLITNMVWEKRKVITRHGKLKKLQGLWIEKFTNVKDGGYALGAFRLSKSDNNYRYDGTRFSQSGEWIYHWETRALVIDKKMELIVYTYEHRFRDGRDPQFGLGTLEYFTQDDNKKIVSFKSGVFSDKDESQHVSLEMKRFEKVAAPVFNENKMDEESRIILGKHLLSKRLKSSLHN